MHTACTACAHIVHTRAYATGEGSARIEMDVYLGVVGIPAELFDATLSLWLKSVTDFEEVIDW